MKALILGGSGFFGSVAARRLAQGRCFDQVLLATRDVSKVAALVEELPGSAQAIELDLSDHTAMVDAARRADIVVNLAGAALVTAVPAMRAAAEAGRHYCDIAAECDVLLQAESVAEELEAAGNSFVVGAGFHPGVTDLLGEVAIRSLDTTRSLELYIVGNFPDYGDSGTFLQMVDAGWQGTEGLKAILSSIGLPTTIVSQGSRTVVHPWEHTQHTSTPDGFPVDFTYFGSLEPLALQRRHPDIDEIAIYYGAWPNAINVALKQVAPEFAAGRTTSGDALREVFSAALPGEPHDPAVHFWAEARGTKDGRDATCRVFSRLPWATTAEMVGTTTGTVCLAAELLATGAINRPGLCTASEVLDPMETFAYLSSGGDHGLQVEYL